MDDDGRRKRIAAVLIIAVPVLLGLGFAALAHFTGNESGHPAPSVDSARSQAPSAAPTGSQAPTVDLRDARSDRPLAAAALRGRAYAAVFVSTRCVRVGRQLRKVLARVRATGPVAVLAISSDPATDTEARARAWLRRTGAPSNLHFLVGSEAELRPYWRAWGANPAAGASGGPACPGAVPIHLVTSAGANAGVVDLGPETDPSLLAADLESLAG